MCPGDHIPYFREKLYTKMAEGSGLCSTPVEQKEEHVWNILVQIKSVVIQYNFFLYKVFQNIDMLSIGIR